MKEMVICKSCGYVMAKSGLRDKCPACGVPAKMFEPYTERISPVRKTFLALDIHPILVHFTQAFAATIPILCLVALAGFARIDIHQKITATITVLAVALPFVVALSLLAGLLDGRIRFRRVTTPLLITKIAFSTVLFLLSSAILATVLAHQPLNSSALIKVLALGIPASGCSGYLGFLGVKLLNSAFPG